MRESLERGEGREVRGQKNAIALTLSFAQASCILLPGLRSLTFDLFLMAELKTFVFTDISGSVRLKDEMSGRSVTERDVAFITSILTPHRELIEGRLPEFNGRVVSTAGDGHFLVFD